VNAVNDRNDAQVVDFDFEFKLLSLLIKGSLGAKGVFCCQLEAALPSAYMKFAGEGTRHRQRNNRKGTRT